MAQYEDYTISGPSFNVKFSPVDQDDGREAAVLALRSGLQRTVNDIPILAGQMGHTPNGWTVKTGKALLRVKQLDMSFAELESNKFSERMLPADVISTVPTLADPQNEWHACRIQANFIRGGLLLVISINHATMDGYGITKATEALARNCHVDEAGLPTQPLTFDRSPFMNCEGKGDVERLAAYSVVTGPSKFGALSTSITTITYGISIPSLKVLKIAASPSEGWITSHDAVNALCWRAHARGRHQAKIISDDDIARFAFPVDFRRLMNPPITPHYIGNAVLMTKVELPVKTLLGPDGLSIAAATIRAGVREIDTAYVENFIAVAKSLETPGQLKINLKLEHPETGFGSTSYKSFTHSTFDWDPCLGNFERFRLSWGATGEGMSVVLPVLGDGSWEVTVTLEEALLEYLKNDEEWDKYTS